MVVVCLAVLAGCSQSRGWLSLIRPSPTRTPDPAPAAPAARVHGTLLLSGGTRTAGALIAEAARIMAGSSARVLVVPVVSPRGDGGKADVDTWRKAGFSEVETLDAADAAHAESQIDAATFIWMTGVDPSRLIDQLVESGASAHIRARYEAGAVVGGTNAGASAVAELMIVAGGDDAEMQTGRVPTVGGLGLWRGVIVDEHFVSKKRFNKLMAAVIDHPQFVGVGIDEATGVVFDGSTIRVVGEGNVVVLDARHATVNPSRPGDASSATGVEMQVLAGGMSYELVKR
jgi:cyanophycinase